MAKSRIETKKQQKHNLILSVSEELMKKDGLHSLNMNDVAKEAKLAKGTLYLYFQSREDIIAALAFKARKLLLKTFQEQVKNEKTALEKLRAIVNANYIFLIENQLYYELVSFYETNERETETPEMQKVIGDITKLIVSIIENGQRDNEIKESINPVTLSFSMWGMTVGIMQLLKNKSQVIESHGQLTEESIISNYLEIFINGIKK